MSRYCQHQFPKLRGPGEGGAEWAVLRDPRPGGADTSGTGATEAGGCELTNESDGHVMPDGEARQAARPGEVAWRSMGAPNSVARQFDFWDDHYEGRRLFAELLGTFFLVLVAVGGGMVNARFGDHA